MKLGEIAERIRAHLKRFEGDDKINRWKTPREGDTRPYWNANAWHPGGSKMRVHYISYQGSLTLSKAEALTYLAWLDAGNEGRHFEAIPRARR